MIFWIIRGGIIILASALGFYIQQGVSGVLIGAGVSLAVIMLELIISKIKLDTLIAGVIGIVLGMIAAQIVDYIIFLSDEPKVIEIFRKYIWLIRISFAYLGLSIALQKKSEVDLLDKDIIKNKKQTREIIILDTSIIIDGRIVDIVATKFLQTPLFVPRFVLHELQLLADAQEHNKRIRAKRGLEMLNKLKEDNAINIIDVDYPNIKD
ncbi:MAG: hypothetical protein N2Z73_02980, partial [Endomicrobia bacterium]|nr:hypothetical protein [Endomicrobiia bacterium]